MTLTIDQSFPAPGAVDVSPSVSVSFSLVTDDQPVDRLTLNVWVDGRHLIVDGQPGPGSRLQSSGLGGFDVVAATNRRLPDQQVVEVRVVADDTSAASPIDVSWTFTVADSRGPVIDSAEPTPGSITPLSPTSLFITLADPGTGNDPVPVLQDFVANPANLQFVRVGETTAQNQIEFDPAGGQGFVGREGQLIEVNSGLDVGKRRVITSVQGPGLATYGNGPVDQLLGSAESVTVFDDKGLDVVVDGVRVIHSGFPDQDAVDAGWSANVNVVPPKLEILISPPVLWNIGDRVSVFIHAADASGQVSDISYFFDVGDTQGPRVINVVPEEGTRGISVNPTPDSDIQFDVISALTVNTSTLNVEVNGVPAITAGVGVGDWAGSTVTNVDASRERVVLKRSTPYTDGEIVFIDINVDDNQGNPGERRILRMHFGAADGTSAVNTTLGGTDIVRVISYDLNETSFARPEELNHTGYAWDGFWYNAGNRSTKVASWFTELGAFPLAGSIVVTAANGWAIIRPQDPGPWMTCAPITSPAWSMADNSTLVDADFGPDAVLALAGSNVLVVDFTRDRVERYNSAGRTYGLGTISQRNSNQAGGASNVAYAIPLGPYQAMSCVRSQRDFVLALGSTGELTVLQEVSAELDTTLRGREQINVVPPRVVTRSAPGTWKRIRLGHLEDAANLTAMVVAYNDAGQGQIELWDWFQFLLTGPSVLAFFDDASSPALTATEIKDLDISHTPEHLAIAAAMVGEIVLLDWDIDAQSASAQVFDETTLGLAGVASAVMSAVALEPGFTPGHGHIYAAVSAPADGRVNQFRVHSPGGANRFIELASGQPFTTIAAIGRRRSESVFVNMSMDVI